MKLKDVFKEGTKDWKDVLKIYSDRTKVLRLFWNEYFSGYHRKLKFTPKWLDRFEHDIPKNTFVLLKEKNMKAGRYIPAVVVDVHRRKNNLISRLKLKTTENKHIIERDIRSCFMLEHDYLALAEKEGHHCILQNISSNGVESQVQVPINNLIHNIVNKSVAKMSKRGNERMFSTQTFVPKKA